MAKAGADADILGSWKPDAERIKPIINNPK